LLDLRVLIGNKLPGVQFLLRNLSSEKALVDWFKETWKKIN